MKRALFQLSSFVTKQFQEHPELESLLSKVDFNLLDDWNHYIEDQQAQDPFKTLRKYRKSRLALIAAIDAKNSDNEFSNHREALKNTSLLADILIKKAYEIVAKEFKQKYGEVINSEGGVISFIVFALGKLGGKELNFSSDVDLVFCSTGVGQSNGEHEIDSTKYFDRFGRRLIQLLDTQTLDGRVYQVDMRLRPFGSAAPLVCTVAHLLNYLRTEGRDWERYAWLRARGVAGPVKEIESTITTIQPFIYRKYLDYGIFESLRQIKKQIQRKQLNDLDNIKLGKGGIREVEFIIQTLQLTFAGRDKELRGSDLWKALKNLHKKNHLKDIELANLKSAWLFLRKLENYCQIIDDHNRHHVPTDARLLALALGFEDETLLYEMWQKHRQNVHTLFLETFINNSIDSNSNDSSFAIQEQKDKVSSKKLPKEIKHKLYKVYDSFDIQYQSLENSQKLVFSRFVEVIQKITKRSSYLSMLIESPFVLQNLIIHLKSEPYFFEAIKQTPQLFELLFEKQIIKAKELQSEWQNYKKRHATDDEEGALELLCQFKLRIQFLIISNYVFEHKDEKICSEQLTELAKIILQQSLNTTFKFLKNNHNRIDQNQLVVIAYGSLATRTMTLKSDFDLVFIWDGELNEQNQNIVFRWIKRLIHFLSTPSYFGKLYKLDTQLRPNGNSGALVISKNNFDTYQRQKAWVWELAALIKSRCVIATKEQKEWFDKLRLEVLTTKRDEGLVNKELMKMSQKIQKHKANQHNEEFKTLGLILNHSHQFPQLTNWETRIAALLNLNLVSSKQAQEMVDYEQNVLQLKLKNSMK